MFASTLRIVEWLWYTTFKIIYLQLINWIQPINDYQTVIEEQNFKMTKGITVNDLIAVTNNVMIPFYINNR